MINKGKGKLKWERDMPRDIEEKLEVTSSSFSVFQFSFEFEEKHEVMMMILFC